MINNNIVARCKNIVACIAIAVGITASPAIVNVTPTYCSQNVQLCTIANGIISADQDVSVDVVSSAINIMDTYVSPEIQSTLVNNNVQIKLIGENTPRVQKEGVQAGLMTNAWTEYPVYSGHSDSDGNFYVSSIKRGTFTLYISADSTQHYLANAILHEIGHVLDAIYNGGPFVITSNNRATTAAITSSWENAYSAEMEQRRQINPLMAINDYNETEAFAESYATYCLYGTEMKKDAPISYQSMSDILSYFEK